MPVSSKYWTMLLIGIFSLLRLQAQNLDSTRAMAQTAMLGGHYDAAEVLWMRVAFFSKEPLGFEALTAMAEVQFQQGQFQKAAEGYAYAAHLAPNDSLRAHCTFRAAAAWLQLGDYAKVRERLQVMGPQADSLAERRRQFFLGSAAYGLADYVMAEAHWAGCTDDSLERSALGELFHAHARLQPKHPGVAILLSAIVPGLGQVYNGAPLKAVNGLLLVGAIVGGGLYLGAVVGIADAIVLFLPPFIRYHVGGARRAGQDAKSRLAAKQQVLLQQMLEIIEN